MLPQLVSDIPGERSRRLARRLGQAECRNVTYCADDWPVFWERAEGVNVWDVDGNRYLDLTSAFGVAGPGHGYPAVVEAMRQQSGKLLHAMGDVHPTELKVRLCEKLSQMTFGRWGFDGGKVILTNSGFEAVEAAFKTAYLATGRREIVSFKGGYHGLGYGALMGGSFPRFREPFEGQLADLNHRLIYPRSDSEVDLLGSQLDKLDAKRIGAVIVEPILGRGGKVVPAERFHSFLREWCDAHEVILIHDEIYSGFQRSGRLFASDWWGVRPDILCLGKALSGGFPISACVGREDVMDRWPESTGEALHTSTFLGHPVGCAMALASLNALDHERIGEKVLESGFAWRERLEAIDSPLIHEIRGRGLMLGMELRHTDSRPAGDVSGPLLAKLLAKGIIALADGVDGNVLAFTPPFDFSREEIDFVASSLEVLLHRAQLRFH